MPGILDRYGAAFKAAAMVRLMHAMVRFNALHSSKNWDVRAPFAYPTNSRFSDELAGAYYAAGDLQTAVAEVSFHRARFAATTPTPPMDFDEPRWANTTPCPRAKRTGSRSRHFPEERLELRSTHCSPLARGRGTRRCRSRVFRQRLSSPKHIAIRRTGWQTRTPSRPAACRPVSCGEPFCAARTG
jgi:hypothetical protein